METLEVNCYKCFYSFDVITHHKFDKNFFAKCPKCLTKHFVICNKSEWIDINDHHPPDEEVEVIDNEGVIALATPTYYPFEVKKLKGDEYKQWGWRGTPIFYEDGIMKWDGGWMFNCSDLKMVNIGTILKWRKKTNTGAKD